jgi:hypothetical protein
MSMFSFLPSKSLSPDWTFTASGMIWRMLLAEPERIVGECRDPEKKVASFFCIDLSSGKPLWKDLVLDELWWVGIETVRDNVILLHTFSQPDMPQHKGIRALDVSSGVELWRNDDVSYWFGHGGRVIAYRDFFEKRVGYEMDLRSGALLKTHDTSLNDLQELRRLDDHQQSSDVTLPEVFTDEEAIPPIADIIRKETKGKKLAGKVEYITQRDFLLFNYHVPQGESTGESPKLENNFMVYDLSSGKRIFAKVIARDLTGYVPDAFFLKGPLAIFIQDQKALTALRLWKS